MNIPRTRLWWMVAVLLLLLFLLLYWRQCSIPGLDPQANLLVNGDAEAGPGSPDGVKVMSVPGWEVTGQFNTIVYGATSYPGPNNPGPARRGKNFFSGGPDTPLSTATQLVNVARYARGIDAHGVICRLSGYLGGYDEQNDHAVLTAEFLDSSSAALGTLSIGPVLAQDRQLQRGLLSRSAHVVLPAGTRTIRVTLTITRTDGQANDGYADNLELTLESSPK
jgi:hypothetical protein